MHIKTVAQFFTTTFTAGDFRIDLKLLHPLRTPIKHVH